MCLAHFHFFLLLSYIGCCREAQLAAEDYLSMRQAMDEFMDEGHVPGSLVMELSRRVLDAEIEDSAPIVMAESDDQDEEDENDHDTDDIKV